MTPSVSPFSQAIDARAVLLADAQQDVDHRNKAAASQYAEAVRQWLWNKQQQKIGTELPPIPVPPKAWMLVPHSYTAAELAYDAAYPGILPLLDEAQIGPAVAPQYIEVGQNAGLPPAPVVHVGQYLRDGEYAALPDDNMPAGYLTRAPDGTFVRKMIQATPFGSAQWYQAVQ